MVFNSLHFALFFVVILVGTRALRRRIAARNLLLLAASYYFYAWWDWRFLGLLILSTVVDYTAALRIERAAGLASRRGAWLAFSIAVNLGLLGFFKYFDFFVDSTAVLLGGLGLQPHLPVLDVVLPVGISFYTFQTLSYTIDVYRGQFRAERNPLTFALYVAFFPQLVAGPIERAARLLPQLREPASPTWASFYSGAYLIAAGLFKKVVLADNAAWAVDSAFAIADPRASQVMLGIYAFAIQVYCDFSGYTDIARGSARCMGFELMRNFNLPFFSANPAEFWERWHISLSTWVRDYIYFPLGGSRRGAMRTYFNLMLIMTLMGLWHGAGWTYVLWGAYHGALVCAHRAVRPIFQRLVDPRQPILAALWRIARIAVFVNLLCLSFILFRSPDLGHSWTMACALATGALRILPADAHAWTMLAAAASLLLLVQIAQQWRKDHYVLFQLPIPVRSVIYAAAIVVFAAFGEFYGEPFIYFQF